MPLPKNHTPLLAFGLEFRPSPNSLHFPQRVLVRVLIKTLVVPIFGAKECIRMQDFVATPEPRQMLVPLRFFVAGYGPAGSGL